jgi:hypothetical protein
VRVERQRWKAERAMEGAVCREEKNSLGGGGGGRL